jgi:hypothetical protein
MFFILIPTISNSEDLHRTVPSHLQGKGFPCANAPLIRLPFSTWVVIISYFGE